MQSFACEHHTSTYEFLVEVSHVGQKLLARHFTGFEALLALTITMTFIVVSVP
jgi:hypothetical protein